MSYKGLGFIGLVINLVLSLILVYINNDISTENYKFTSIKNNKIEKLKNLLTLILAYSNFITSFLLAM